MQHTAVRVGTTYRRGVNPVAEVKDGGGPEKPRLHEDSIVAHLTSGSSAPIGLRSFIGLLGRSAAPGRWVLYPALDMSLAIEISEADIAHSEQLSPEKSPFGSL